MNKYYCTFVFNGQIRVFYIETAKDLPFKIVTMATLILKNPDPWIFIKDRYIDHRGEQPLSTPEDVLAYLKGVEAGWA